jgi:hypothetical protein
MSPTRDPPILFQKIGFLRSKGSGIIVSKQSIEPRSPQNYHH